MSDERWMRHALELARRGQGRVEPNPQVGCVIVAGGECVGAGWHAEYGGPHAEIAALRQAQDQARDATLYVTLEPCAHHGKTPPCTDAILAAGIARVVVAMGDPFAQVAGRGIAQLRQAGVVVEQGLLQDEAERLAAPYLTLVRQGRPWTIAKWAMTLDGKIATASGDSRWISNSASRARVHVLRGRMDAIVVGRRTAERDDPLLTARPPGPRVATRVVVDSLASLPASHQLVRSAREAPTLLAVGPRAPADRVARLADAGVEVLRLTAEEPQARLAELWREFGGRRFTNVLVEGGGALLGSLFDLDLIDEVQAVIATKISGGDQAPGPLGGRGASAMAAAAALREPRVESVEGDIWVRGRLH